MSSTLRHTTWPLLLQRIRRHGHMLQEEQEDQSIATNQERLQSCRQIGAIINLNEVQVACCP